VTGRTLEEEADADRGRVLFSSPFRRLQNKAQVFSLESNAAVRSRLTHSLEVSAIGHIVTQQSLTALGPKKLKALGITGKERSLITFVETACLLHDIGNPPFGHFGELVISDWFHQKANSVKPTDIGGATLKMWDKYYADFRHFDGNPQGLRICTRLQPSHARDVCGLNLTATTLAGILKYPWTSDMVGEAFADRDEVRKKPGLFWTEKDIIDWVTITLGITPGCRHPLVYLMEAADDIAYCISDIEDGIEKGLITGEEFANYMLDTLKWSARLKGSKNDPDVKAIRQALKFLRNPVRQVDGESVQSLTAVRDLRGAVIRSLSRQAGASFARMQTSILAGTAGSLLREGQGLLLLNGLKDFASRSLYSSTIVRSRELTAYAVLSGLLDAYHQIMRCERGRFEKMIAGATRDDAGRSIARESALVGRIARKYLAVYQEAVRTADAHLKKDPGGLEVMERIHRMRLIVDYVSGMTDEFALQSFQHISGAQVNPYRN
jgi:dGTPase